MRSVKLILAAGAASLLSTAVFAADMPSIMAPPLRAAQYDPGVGDPGDPGGWYLRGDIGFANDKVKSLYNTDYNLGSTQLIQQSRDFDTAGIVSVGVGYQFNSWLRADITGQYRGNANFKGMDRFTYNFGGQGYAIDTYSTTKSAVVGLVNVYADLGTWYKLTPFVGVGVGAARVTLGNLTDTSQTNDPTLGPTTGIAFGNPTTKTNLAWALHAGMAYKVDPNLTLELGYHYLNMGDGLSGDLTTFTNINSRYNPISFNTLTSHDLTIGMRWNLDPCPPVYVAPPMPQMAPLVRKG